MSTTTAKVQQQQWQCELFSDDSSAPLCGSGGVPLVSISSSCSLQNHLFRIPEFVALEVVPPWVMLQDLLPHEQYPW